MQKSEKKGNVLGIIISIICLFTVTALLYFLLQERDKRLDVEEQLVIMEEARDTLQEKLEQSQVEAVRLQKEANILMSQIEEEKKKYEDVLATFKSKQEQIEELQMDLSNEKKQRTSFANALAQLKEKCEELELKVKEEQKKAQDYQRQLGGAPKEPGVRLKRIVVKPKKELSGKVLVVNREFHFMVVDLGNKDGIDVGDELRIYQDAEQIGTAQVEKVYEDMSTAAILAGSQEHRIKEDSVVKTF